MTKYLTLPFDKGFKSLAGLIMILIAFTVIINTCAGRHPPKDPKNVLEKDGAALTGHPSDIAFDTLDWKVPLGDPHRLKLKNGPIAYVAVDSSLPLVNIEAHIRSGSLNDPIGKEGLGSMMARLMRVGGTAQYHADTLDMLVDLLAMSFSFSQTESSISFKAAFLSEYTDTAMQIMQQLFFAPAFQPEKLEKERSIMLEGIRHRFVNPGPTLGVAYRKHQYYQYAPAKLSTEASLNNITREDLVTLHKAAFSASDIIISVSGKFDRKEMISKLNTVFSTKITPQNAPFPEIAIAPQTRALVVHKDINQAYIRMGLPLFKRPHPDYYAVSLLNYILGGSGFTSRLATRVRSDEGLTYSIHSSAESNYTYAGTMFVNFFTKTELFPKAISIVLEELDKVVKDGVTDKELEDARTALIAELPSSFRNPEDIVSTYAWNEFYGRAPDHYAKYPDELRKLTGDDIKKAAKKYIDINKITYTIVGDTTAINAASASAPASGFFVLDSLKSKLVVVADSLVKF